MKEWKRAGERLAENPGVALLLGAPDRGKTTLTCFLANVALGAGRRVAIVDSDVGQSDIGPPGTVGLGIVQAPLNRMRDAEPAGLYFVGSNSPGAAMLPLAVGVKAMVNKARELGAEVIIVDTSGLVSGRMARVLKSAKMELVRPRHVVAIQEANEVESLLRPVEYLAGVTVHRLPVSPRARVRSREERRGARQRSYARYFREAGTLELPLEGITWVGTLLGSGRRVDPGEYHHLASLLGGEVVYAEKGAEGLYLVAGGTHRRGAGEEVAAREGLDFARVVRTEDFDHLYCALLDEGGEVLALGILAWIDLQAGLASFVTPWREAERVRAIRPGLLRLTPEGEERGRITGEEL